MQEDDPTLLRRFADTGAQDAFAEVVRRNMNAVYSAALRRVGGDAHLADDVVQQVFVRLAQHAAVVARHPFLPGWLYTVTRNAAVNVIRTESRRRCREQEAHAMKDVFSGAHRDADWNQVAPVLDEVIDELGEDDRRAILLRFFDRCTFAKIGATLQLTEDAARMRVDRAVVKLRTLFARRGIRSTAAALGAALAQHTVTAAPAGLAETAIEEAMSAVAPTPFALRPGIEKTALVGAPVVLLVAIAWVLLGDREQQRGTAALLAAKETIVNLEARLRVLDREAAAQTAPTTEPVTPVLVAPDATPTPPLPQARAGGRRLEVSANYDALYRSLGLTAAQIEQFEAIAVLSSDSAMWRYELDPRNAVPLALPQQLAATESEEKLRALLGEPGYDRYVEYNRSLPAREWVEQLAGSVYLSDPLLPEQGEALARILANASADYRAGGNIDRVSLDWEHALTEAANILSPRQLAALGGAVRSKEALHQALLQRVVSPTASAGMAAR